MYHLGLHYYGHDTSVALFKNDKLLFALEEERLSRIKHDKNIPYKALDYVVKKYNISSRNLSSIDFATIPERLLKKKYLDLFSNNPNTYKELFFHKKNISNIKKLTEIKNILKKNIFPQKKHNYHHHHLCHQYSAYILSGFKKATCISVDGLGEIESACIGYANNGKIKILDYINYPDTLGETYTAITEFLGYKVDSDEGTVMALAALGNSKPLIRSSKLEYKKIFTKIIKIKTNGKYEIDLSWFNYWNTRGKLRVSDKFLKLFGNPRKKKQKLNQNYFNIAAALQERFEEAYKAYVARAIKKTKIKNVVLSGGCALNCKANGVIAKKLKLTNLYIQPASGDAGSAVGAAYLGYLNYKKNQKFNAKYYEHTYFGPEYSNREILRSIKKNNNIKFRSVTNVENECAKLILKDKVVGWFQGKLEFGARALGNRSILASPLNKMNKIKINKYIKKREYFRPFAPSVLENYENKIFDLKCPSPFMLIATSIKSKYRNKINAVKHYDESARIQVVTKKNNLKYYKLINEFYKISSIPILLNTSNNGKGEPILCSPEDAINSFLKNKIDYLVKNNFIIVRKNAKKSS